MYNQNLIQPQNFGEGRTAKIDCRFSWFQSSTMNLFFPQHALQPHVILRGSEGEVAESMRKNPRIDMDSATPCRMTSRGGDRMEEETSSIEVSRINYAV